LVSSIPSNSDFKELPYITEGLKGVGGRIKEKPEDFVVEEQPLYEPDGSGSHLFLNVTRQGITTRDIVNIFSKLFGVNRFNIGYAGLKDKYSNATQTFSILVGDTIDSPSVYEWKIKISGLPIQLNWAKFHRRKLRPGHLLGNRFSIRITRIEMDIDEALHRANSGKKVFPSGVA
jgi:tRNA pseudouridine13 synthase